MVLFSPLMTFTEKMLDVTTLRHRVIANNAANVNTPGFKRSEVSFTDALNRIKQTGKDQGPFMNADNTPDINEQLMQNLSLEKLYQEGASYENDLGVGYSLSNTKFDMMFKEHPAAGPDSRLDPRAPSQRSKSRADLIGEVQPKIMQTEDVARQDGNNINPEIEMANMIKNTSFYNVLVSSISGEFRTLKTIISNR